MISLNFANVNAYTKGKVVTKNKKVTSKSMKVKHTAKKVVVKKKSTSTKASSKTKTASQKQTIIKFKNQSIEFTVRDQIKKPKGDITITDINKITSLTLNESSMLLRQSKQNIGDLSDLKYFTNLKELYLSGDMIVTNDKISSFRNLVSLKKLYLNCTGITDISMLKNLTNLTYLELDMESINNISILKNFTKLDTLILFNASKTTDITVLQGLKNLKLLTLPNTQLNQEQIDALHTALPNCKIVH